mmetsp:Transcript_24181/g.57191  ORF Transcript_24181/g.57191 Transcript_24181/m.57191 type:complete len:94 (-) Transcript_24181:1637-1918(-)
MAAVISSSIKQTIVPFQTPPLLGQWAQYELLQYPHCHLTFSVSIILFPNFFPRHEIFNHDYNHHSLAMHISKCIHNNIIDRGVSTTAGPTITS